MAAAGADAEPAVAATTTQAEAAAATAAQPKHQQLLLQQHSNSRKRTGCLMLCLVDPEGIEHRPAVGKTCFRQGTLCAVAMTGIGSTYHPHEKNPQIACFLPA